MTPKNHKGRQLTRTSFRNTTKQQEDAHIKLAVIIMFVQWSLQQNCRHMCQLIVHPHQQSILADAHTRYVTFKEWPNLLIYKQPVKQMLAMTAAPKIVLIVATRHNTHFTKQTIRSSWGQTSSLTVDGSKKSKEKVKYGKDLSWLPRRKYNNSSTVEGQHSYLVSIA